MAILRKKGNFSREHNPEKPTVNTGKIGVIVNQTSPRMQQSCWKWHGREKYIRLSSNRKNKVQATKCSLATNLFSFINSEKQMYFFSFSIFRRTYILSLDPASFHLKAASRFLALTTQIPLSSSQF